MRVVLTGAVAVMASGLALAVVQPALADGRPEAVVQRVDPERLVHRPIRAHHPRSAHRVWHRPQSSPYFSSGFPRLYYYPYGFRPQSHWRRWHRD